MLTRTPAGARRLLPNDKCSRSIAGQMSPISTMRAPTIQKLVANINTTATAMTSEAAPTHPMRADSIWMRIISGWVINSGLTAAEVTFPT